MTRWNDSSNIIFDSTQYGSSVGFRTGKLATTYTSNNEVQDDVIGTIKSVSFWVKCNSTSVNPQTILNLNYDNGTKVFTGVYSTTSGGSNYISPNMFTGVTTTYIDATSGSSEVGVDTWHFITITDDIGAIQGNLHTIGLVGIYDCDFVISNVRYYNIELTAEEVEELYDYYRITSSSPSKFTIIQSYMGVKEGYFEVENAMSDDIIDFVGYTSNKINFALLQNSSGTVIDGLICNTSQTVTIGSGVADEFVIGTVKYSFD